MITVFNNLVVTARYGLHLIIHQIIGLIGYIGPPTPTPTLTITITPVLSSVSLTVR